MRQPTLTVQQILAIYGTQISSLTAWLSGEKSFLLILCLFYTDLLTNVSLLCLNLKFE